MTIKKKFLLFLLVALSLARLKQKSSQSFTNNLESLIQKGKQFGANLLNKGKENLTKSYQWLWKTNKQKDSLDPIQNNSEKKLSTNKLNEYEKNISDENIINQPEQNSTSLIEKNVPEKLEPKEIKKEQLESQKQKIKEQKIKIKKFFKEIIENTEHKKILKELKRNPDKDKIQSFLNSIFENNSNFNLQEKKKMETFFKKKINSKYRNIKNKKNNTEHKEEKDYSKENTTTQEKILQKESAIAGIQKRKKEEKEIENKLIQKKIANHILIPNNKKITKEKKIKKIYEKIKILNFISNFLNNKNQFINRRKNEKNV